MTHFPDDPQKGARVPAVMKAWSSLSGSSVAWFQGGHERRPPPLDLGSYPDLAKAF